MGSSKSTFNLFWVGITSPVWVIILLLVVAAVTGNLRREEPEAPLTVLQQFDRSWEDYTESSGSRERFQIFEAVDQLTRSFRAREAMDLDEAAVRIEKFVGDEVLSQAVTPTEESVIFRARLALNEWEAQQVDLPVRVSLIRVFICHDGAGLLAQAK